MSYLSSLMTVKMNLDNLIYISYRLPSDRLRPLVPEMLALSSDIEDRAYFSLVAMECRKVRLSRIPWPSFNYRQLNLRTYVIDPESGAPAVYFFRSGVTLRLVSILTGFFGLSWEKGDFRIGQNPYNRYYLSGRWMGDVDFEIETQPGGILDEALVKHLTSPGIGFMGRGKELRRFRISHKSLDVKGAKLNSIRFNMAPGTGIIGEQELKAPDSVLMVPRTEFTVHLPPERSV